MQPENAQPVLRTTQAQGTLQNTSEPEPQPEPFGIKASRVLQNTSESDPYPRLRIPAFLTFGIKASRVLQDTSESEPSSARAQPRASRTPRSRGRIPAP